MEGEYTSNIIIFESSNGESDTKSSGKGMNEGHFSKGASALTALFDFTSHSSALYGTEIMQITTLEFRNSMRYNRSNL